jgi:hypothetical protein
VAEFYSEQSPDGNPQNTPAIFKVARRHYNAPILQPGQLRARIHNQDKNTQSGQKHLAVAPIVIAPCHGSLRSRHSKTMDAASRLCDEQTRTLAGKFFFREGAASLLNVCSGPASPDLARF